ncbi:MAG: hypothetical protein JF623_07485 [Acidobacteria bacterium]|nr:hypothetical protein [Acidobacteriota bacterium]
MRAFLPTVAIVAVVVAGCGGGKGAHSDTPAVTSPASSTAPANTTHGAGSSSVSTSTTATGAGNNVVTHGRYHYPPVLIRNYMKSCVGAAGGGSKKRGYCACTLDKLSNNVSTRDFAEIGLSHGRIPPRIKRFMTNAVADCANQL